MTEQTPELKRVIGLPFLILALFFPLVTIAKLTSVIILAVFAIVNLALWRIKGRNPDPVQGEIHFPRWLPLLGFLTCTTVLTYQAWQLVNG